MEHIVYELYLNKVFFFFFQFKSSPIYANEKGAEEASPEEGMWAVRGGKALRRNLPSPQEKKTSAQNALSTHSSTTGQRSDFAPIFQLNVLQEGKGNSADH